MSEYIPLTSTRAFEYLKENSTPRIGNGLAVVFGAGAVGLGMAAIIGAQLTAMVLDRSAMTHYGIKQSEQIGMALAFGGFTATSGTIAALSGVKSLDTLLSNIPGWRLENTPTLTRTGIYMDEPTPFQSAVGKRLYLTNTLEEACERPTARGYAHLVNGVNLEEFEPVKKIPEDAVTHRIYEFGLLRIQVNYGTTFRFVLADGSEHKAHIWYSDMKKIVEKETVYAVIQHTGKKSRVLDIGPSVTGEDFTGNGRKKKERQPAENLVRAPEPVRGN